MCWSEPVSRLATHSKLWPSSNRLAHRWEPINPAPPVTTILNILWQGVPPHSCARRNCHVRSSPSLPLLSSLDCFVHVCYHPPLRLGTSASPEETLFVYRGPFHRNTLASALQPT